jgi:hypothetical protein
MYGVNSSGNPDVVPAEAGNQHLEYWIPLYQVQGRLRQAQKDELSSGRRRTDGREEILE